VRRAVIAAIAALTLVAAAAAATQQPFVSYDDQQRIELALSYVNGGDLAYFPFLGPAHYELGANNSNTSQVILTFADVRYSKEAPTIGRSHAMIYTVTRYRPALSKCGGTNPRTIVVGGKRVFWDGKNAWLCFETKRHTRIKVSAYGPYLTGPQLARTIASVKHGVTQQ
jgi:hypothetical protein